MGRQDEVDMCGSRLGGALLPQEVKKMNISACLFVSAYMARRDCWRGFVFGKRKQREGIRIQWSSLAGSLQVETARNLCATRPEISCVTRSAHARGNLGLERAGLGAHVACAGQRSTGYVMNRKHLV